MNLKKNVACVFNNCRKPEGLLGKIILRGMNFCHSPAHRWGRGHLYLHGNERILDVGCGGGSNIAAFLKMSPTVKVVGVDYSEESVRYSLKLNAKAVGEGRCKVVQGNVLQLEFGDDEFDIVTAFETIYFWPDIVKSMREVHRVLKPGGIFLICNETDGTQASANRWADIINGMTNYTKESLNSILLQAGFKDIRSDINKKHFLCVFAKS